MNDLGGRIADFICIVVILLFGTVLLAVPIAFIGSMLQAWGTMH